MHSFGISWSTIFRKCILINICLQHPSLDSFSLWFAAGVLVKPHACHIYIYISLLACLTDSSMMSSSAHICLATTKSILAHVLKIVCRLIHLHDRVIVGHLILFRVGLAFEYVWHIKIHNIHIYSMHPRSQCLRQSLPFFCGAKHRVVCKNWTGLDGVHKYCIFYIFLVGEIPAERFDTILH